jgi:hypothetical protein
MNLKANLSAYRLQVEISYHLSFTTYPLTREAIATGSLAELFSQALMVDDFHRGVGQVTQFMT